MADRASPPTRTLWVVLACTAVCYLVGYPLALVAHQTVGWVFVTLGGPLLIALGVLTIRHLTRPPAGRGDGSDAPDSEVADDSSTR